jgi:hypothetical protein
MRLFEGDDDRNGETVLGQALGRSGYVQMAQHNRNEVSNYYRAMVF